MKLAAAMMAANGGGGDCLAQVWGCVWVYACVHVSLIEVKRERESAKERDKESKKEIKREEVLRL
jgi:hypothetical protein